MFNLLYGGIQQPDQRGFNKEIDLLEWRELLKYKVTLSEGKGTAYFHIYVLVQMVMKVKAKSYMFDLCPEIVEKLKTLDSRPFQI